MTKNKEQNELEIKIKDFLSKENNYAMAIYGEWGTGKTYLVKNTLKEYFNENNYAYISLSGVTSLEQIEKLLYFSITNTFNEYALPLIEMKFNLKMNPIKIVDFRNKIIVLDDIERCCIKNKNIILGFISRLLEEQLNIVVICDEMDVFGKYYGYEKYIRETINMEDYKFPAGNIINKIGDGISFKREIDYELIKKLYQNLYNGLSFDYHMNVRFFKENLRHLNLRDLKDSINYTLEIIEIYGRYFRNSKDIFYRYVIKESLYFLLKNKNLDRKTTIPDSELIFKYKTSNRKTKNEDVLNYIKTNIIKEENDYIKNNLYSFNYDEILIEEKKVVKELEKYTEMPLQKYVYLFNILEITGNKEPSNLIEIIKNNIRQHNELYYLPEEAYFVNLEIKNKCYELYNEICEHNAKIINNKILENQIDFFNEKITLEEILKNNEIYLVQKDDGKFMDGCVGMAFRNFLIVDFVKKYINENNYDTNYFLTISNHLHKAQIYNSFENELTNTFTYLNALEPKNGWEEYRKNIILRQFNEIYHPKD